MPSVQRSSEGPSSDPLTSTDSKETAKKRATKSIHYHHPYRIELLDVTPVSVSLLWSTRPPPLSAIPLEILNSQLRKRIKSKSTGGSGSSSPSHNTAKATAVSPSPTTATASIAKSRSNNKPSSQSPDRSNAPNKSAPTSSTTQPETPISKLTEGLVATRSLNRKVTKIRLRPPPSAATQGRRSSNSSAPSDSAHNHQQEDEAWPSDEGATAVEDEAASGSEASDSGYEGDSRTSGDRRGSNGNNMVSIFEDRVSVAVNGRDWPHVLMGERGSHEAIVVIFGLEPESDYDVQFLVKSGLDGETDAFRASLKTRADRDSVRSLDSSPVHAKGAGPAASASGVVGAARPASPSPLRRTSVSVSEIAIPPEEAQPQRRAVLQAELEASEALKSSLLAEIKKARKESSKSEASLKHEIDAIKRGMDRMSATDHRFRQKVLALQELIKQTTTHVQEIHEEAEQAEHEQPNWESKEAEVSAELEQLRKEVEAEEDEAQAEWDKDEAAIAALEKEIKSLEATAKTTETERDELKNERLASLQSEIEKVKEQTKDTLNSKPHPASSKRGGGPAQRGAHRHVSNPTQMVPPQSMQKGKGPHAGGRGGKTFNFGNRAVSGPASHIGGPNNHAGTQGFPTPSRGFFHNFGKRNNANRNGAAVGVGGPGAMDPSHAGFNMMPPTLPGAGGFAGPAMADPSLAGMGAYGGTYSGSMDSPFYAVSQQEPHFPSGVSEVSQDDLYDPTLGFDPYDPSPDARRRSSLPLPQMSYPNQAQHQPQPSTSSSSHVLNPANPEFIPSGGSTHASPVISKGITSNKAAANNNSHTVSSTATLPSLVAVSTQSPPPGVASVEHSPTSSSRFAFPLARHQASSSVTSSSLGKLPVTAPATTALGSNNVLSPSLASDLGLPLTSGLGTGSSLFPLGPSGAASPFPRHSPLLPQLPTSSSSATSPLLFANHSPRFGSAHLHGTEDSKMSSTSTSTPFSAASKFGPLDYDPSMEGFGPAPGLGGGASLGSGAFGLGSSSSAGLHPFGSNAMPSLFGANDTWTAPGAPAHTSLGSGSSIGSNPVTSTIGSSTWIAPSPPLGGTIGSAGGVGSGADIWSAPTLPGVSQLRKKMSLNELGGGSNLNLNLDGGIANSNFGGTGNSRMGGLGAIGRNSGSNSSSSHHHQHQAGHIASSPVTSPIPAGSSQVDSERIASPQTAISPAKTDSEARRSQAREPGSSDSDNLSPVEHPAASSKTDERRTTGEVQNHGDASEA